VLDRGKRVVETVEERPPFLIPFGVSEAFGVILEVLPFHEEQIAIRALDAAGQPQRTKPGYGFDDLPGLPERPLEGCLLAGDDIQGRVFQDHLPMMPDAVYPRSGMATWSDFVQQRPDLAEAARRLLYQHGVGLAYIATLRRDGRPRLHPICPILNGSRLFAFIIPSPKQGDLRRDPSYSLHSFPCPNNEDAFLPLVRPGSSKTLAPERRSASSSSASGRNFRLSRLRRTTRCSSSTSNHA